MPIGRKDRTLFRLFGVPIKAHPSWLILVALIVLSLAQGVFRPELGPAVPWYAPWLLAIAATAGLFGSLIAHELCHSLVARHTGMPVTGITLFIFGGVSELGDEPPTAGIEFVMAVVGPLSSLLLGGAFLALWIPARLLGWPLELRLILRTLFHVNLLLAGFNSLPAFPLDGGRILRSVLWGITGQLRLATQVAARVGAFFGVGMMAVGILTLLLGAGVGGLWLAVIGFFLRLAARNSMRMVMMREHLAGRKVRDFMSNRLVTVPRGLGVQEFVVRYVFQFLFDRYPVVDEEGRLVGVIGARAPGRIERRSWPETTVEGLMDPTAGTAVLGPETDATEALSSLSQRQESTSIVVEDGRPVGTIRREDLLRYVSLKTDLGCGGNAG